MTDESLPPEEIYQVVKEPILDGLRKPDTSALRKYQDFFVGSTSFMDLIRYELGTTIFGPWPGSPGYLLRKWFYPTIFRRVGNQVNWGRNITLRHPGKISVGDRVAIDDDCLLDARGAGEEGIQIGSDVLIARSTNIQGKCAWIFIDDHCNIGSQCQFSSAIGIRLGKYVMMGGQCYIGGGRYRMDDRKRPMMSQEIYSKGPVVIEDDVWLGAGVTVLDGVRIGQGSVIGSGAVLREDIPEYTVVTPHNRLIMVPRT